MEGLKVVADGLSVEEMDSIEENERVRAVFGCAIEVGKHSARTTPESESPDDVGFRLLRAASVALGVNRDNSPGASKVLQAKMDHMLSIIMREHAMWLQEYALEHGEISFTRH